jgi:sRNA-binding regulator protein Hfq
MTILILIYFFINTFTAGWCLANEYKRSALILVFLFAVPYLLYFAITELYSFVHEYLQLGFYWGYYIKNGFRKMDRGTIKEVNMYARQSKNTNKLNHIIYRHCIKLLNKRNNYTAE